MNNKNINLYKGNSLKIMEDIPIGSIDAVITDPPYNLSKKNNFSYIKRTGIDFGEWDKDFDLTSWIKSVQPLLKKGGNIIIFNAWNNITTIIKSLEENGFEIKDLIRWEKKNPMPRNTNRRFVSDCEFALWACKKGGKWTFNKLNNPYERPKIYCGITPKREKKLGFHTTQKPIEVMEWIIERLTNEKDTILDPFMGSGSTGVACKLLNRNFIGIELNEDYYNLAVNRINETKMR